MFKLFFPHPPENKKNKKKLATLSPIGPVSLIVPVFWGGAYRHCWEFPTHCRYSTVYESAWYPGKRRKKTAHARTAHHSQAAVRCRRRCTAAEQQQQQQQQQQAGKAEQNVFPLLLCGELGVMGCVARCQLTKFADDARAFSVVCCQYYGLVVPKLQTQTSIALGYSSVAYVACCRLLSARSKSARDSRAKKTVRASLLRLVLAATPDMILAFLRHDSSLVYILQCQLSLPDVGVDPALRDHEPILPQLREHILRMRRLSATEATAGPTPPQSSRRSKLTRRVPRPAAL